MLKTLIVNLIISLGVGGLSAFLTRDSMDIYNYIAVPAFAPPSSVFPIVWTILYVLMAVSVTLVYEGSPKSSGIVAYGLQLLVNFIWPLFFFNGRMFSASFVVLIILWLLVILMIYEFYKVNKTAAYLQIPYLLWLTFAAYLNWNIYLLNR